MRLSYKKPAMCVKELHSTGAAARQHAPALLQAVLADEHLWRQLQTRVVNIDETSCRLLPVHQIGWGLRGVKQAKLQGNTREATTFTVAFSMDRGPLDMLVQIVHAGKTDAVLPEQPWLEHTRSRHVRERLGHHDDDSSDRSGTTC